MAGKPMPVEPRFWAAVKKSDGCWEWTIGQDGHGYGHLSVNNKRIKAHRISWMLHFGEIPAGLWVLHRCDNRKCVRPGHLFLGTRRDNIDDAVSKGRQTKGEMFGHAKLTAPAVKLIRWFRGLGVKNRTLARAFGVSDATCCQAATSDTWRFVA